MGIEFTQKQDRALIEEHARSSFNFTFLSRNELYVAITVFIVGVIIALFDKEFLPVGVPLVLIGLYEIARFGTREKRWVNKKVKEKKFNKDINFELTDNELIVSFNEISKNHKYKDMRACIISDTGVLFKITYLEYYYISFNRIKHIINPSDLTTFLKENFEGERFEIRQANI